jgi:hypothetical protein
MKGSQLEALAILRTIVGYLGEREQHSWWQSSFLSPTSRAFLTPVFARTHVLAQYTGVTRAAGMIHDDRIGVGSVFHLFRLPEDMEQGLHRVVHDARVIARVTVAVRDHDSAVSTLRSLACAPPPAAVGPTRMGTTHDLREQHVWWLVAAHYANGFSSNAEVYPYFTDRTQ